MGGCHATDADGPSDVLLVGNPNVGKSVLFHHLTGVYATVSNYPGTTVALDQGRIKLGDRTVTVTDTPGMYGLVPISDEERVASDMVLRHDGSVVQVADATNLARMLHLTVQLLEHGVPVVLVVNLLDEAERKGITLDLPRLGRRLGVPVLGTVAAEGRGVEAVQDTLADPPGPGPLPAIAYTGLEPAIEALVPILGRGPALRVLAGDERPLSVLPSEHRDTVAAVLAELGTDPTTRIHRVRQAWIDEILDGVVTAPDDAPRRRWSERLGALTMHPVWGVPILLAVLYFGLYRFVGGVGAGTVVDWLEGTLFEQWINPFLVSLTDRFIPWTWLGDLLTGEFGVLTLGVRYAVAIVLPIVGAFFLVFSVIEDSGYLPRLAMLIDRLFKRIGLNGRAVIPMTLGFGCGTMATMVTRTLETRRERFLATLLLALAIPCSAQLGVILAVLSGHPTALLVWAGMLGGVFLLVGWLGAKMLPGERPAFYMELPPLRMPRLGNVLQKTGTRMVWYFREIVPIFLAASVILWFGDLTGLFELAVRGLTPLIAWLGLPAAAAPIFLYGFFRRDYGAAGLYDLQDALTTTQITVIAVVLTLFVPCIAQAAMMVKERGWKTAAAIGAFILPFSFLVGWALNAVLAFLGVTL